MNAFKFFAQDPCSISIELNKCPECGHQLQKNESKEGIFLYECSDCHSTFIQSPLGIIKDSIKLKNEELSIEGF